MMHIPRRSYKKNMNIKLDRFFAKSDSVYYLTIRYEQGSILANSESRLGIFLYTPMRHSMINVLILLFHLIFHFKLLNISTSDIY